MKKQISLIARASQIAIFAFVLLAVQATDAFAQLGFPNPCLAGAPAVLVQANAAQCKAAKAAFAAAVPVVTGNAADEKIYEWIYLIILDKRPEYNGKFGEGLKFSDAVSWLKDHISRTEFATTRAMVIDNAFQEVYGRDSDLTEQATWETQVKQKKAWYATIVAAESEKLSKDTFKRRIMINAAYRQAMGRNALDGDIQYWLPRKEHYRQLIEAQRVWLYSDGGVKDLVETVRRALKEKTGNSPSDEEAKKALGKFTPQKLIFAQMTASK